MSGAELRGCGGDGLPRIRRRNVCETVIGQARTEFRHRARCRPWRGAAMLLRVRVALPDRPGSLGQVARTLGVAGADIVQVVVLERLGGRAIDDFTVVWPGGAGVERLRAGLSAMPGVRVDGVWRAIGAPVAGAF